MQLLIFLSFSFLLTLLIGILLEKLKVPWIFGALLLGMILNFYNPFPKVPRSEAFMVLATFGMYFLLFIIGFEIELHKLLKLKRFIVKATGFIILFEAVFTSLVIHFLFNCPWELSVLIALSFATVGEAMLVPILDECNAINTDVGQVLIGIGTLDDLIELITILFAGVYAGAAWKKGVMKIGASLTTLAILFLLAYGLTRAKKKVRILKVPKLGAMFLVALFIFFLFVGIGSIGEVSAIGAIIAGIALRNFVPKRRIEYVEEQVKALAYGFFAPIFFLWVGMSADVRYIFTHFALLLTVVGVAKLSKVLASVIIARKRMGIKKSVALGVGLSVRFSTSIVIIKFLHELRIIGKDLYSILIGSTIAFKFIIPLIFAYMLREWVVKSRKVGDPSL